MQNLNVIKKYGHIINSSMKPYIEIKAEKKTILSPWQSKFSGMPYLPNNVIYPKSNDGEYLYLIAQINFEETPKLDHFPDKGLLQFWIAANDSLGLNFEDETIQDSFRVLYYPEIKKGNLVSDFSFLPQGEYLPFSDESEYSLSFATKEMPISFEDYRFNKLFPDVNEGFIDEYTDKYNSSGHRIGGYPYFTQTDPRNYDDQVSDDMDILLLQVDSDDNIQWGDFGVANFFINKANLEKKDFSKVLYNWDCC